MKKILVTGALGLVGSHIVESLIVDGNQILGIDNLKTGRRSNLSDSLDLFDLVIDDIAKPGLLPSIAKSFQPDTIIHCAASYSDPNDWIGDARTNIEGSINVALAAKEAESRVIYFQTALCYGLKPTQNPIKIDYQRNPAPSSYAISKTGGELYLENAKIDLVVFRLANIIGPRNLSGALPIFYKRIRESQKCVITEARRDFVDVRDILGVVKKAVGGTGSGAYHLSSGHDVSILELYESVAEKMKNPNQPNPDLVSNPPENAASILLDPTKTFSDFGLINFRSLTQTVSDAVDYYGEFGVTEERTHFHFKK
jgi:nucleoside-diphosphate-sugar epimerase